MADYCDVRLSYMVFPGAVEKNSKVLNEHCVRLVNIHPFCYRNSGFET